VRRLRFRNRRPWDPVNSAKNVQELRGELERRGLSQLGTKVQLIQRIKRHNDWCWSVKGIMKNYHRRRDDVQRAAMERVVPFNLFSKFPTEIRLLIWEFSLLGPRFLNVCDENDHANNSRRTDTLRFLEDDNHPNPAALSTCRESRDIALQRYRLCFGTSYLYADLSGGDILYFGRHCHQYRGFFHQQQPNSLSLRRSHLGSATQETLSPWVVSDLKLITHLALSQNLWWRYRGSYFDDWSLDGALRLRRHLKDFSNLKEVSIIYIGSEEGCFHRTPGTITFENVNVPRDEINEYDNEMIRTFREHDLTEDEKMNGIPEIRIVRTVRIPNIPGDDFNRQLGEPYVRTARFKSILKLLTEGSVLSPDT